MSVRAACALVLATLTANACDCTGVVDGGEGEGAGGVEGEGAGGEGEGEPVGPHVVTDPPPGVFASSFTLTLSVADADPAFPFELWFTTDGSVPEANGPSTSKVTGPIDVTTSTNLRVVATDATQAARFGFFGAYVLLDADAAAFSSNLPVLVFWSLEGVPDDRVVEYATSSLSVIVPGDGGAPGRVQFPSSSSQSVRAGMKVHGSSTAGYPKHPWRIETREPLNDDDNRVALLGMPEDGDWILGAPLDFDRALMRTTLAYALSNAAGRYAARTEFAEVFIAGDGQNVGMDDYVGVYEVTEHLERGADRIDVDKLTSVDVSEPTVTGGYVFKEDREGPGESGFRAGTDGGALTFDAPFVWVDPKETAVVPEQAAYLAQYLDDAGAAVAAGAGYEDLIDVDAFIDHHIINLFAKNPDAFRLSGFYFKDRDGPLVAGPVWDFDRTMGCASDGRADDPTWWDATNVTGDTTSMFDHGFYRGLFRDPAFAARYWARLAESLDGPLSPAQIDPFIDAQQSSLQEAQARNFQRWSDFGPRGSFDDEVELLKAWLHARHDWMQSCLTLPDPQTCTGN